MNIVILGPPGAGKGTHAQSLVIERGMIQLSTGEMLREERDSGTELGRMIADLIRDGSLVSDEIVVELIRKRLAGDSGGGFIFDGFPRTLAQADSLGELLGEAGTALAAAIEIRVDETALTRRILGRSSCGGCGKLYSDDANPWPDDGVCGACGSTEVVRRADDNEESLLTRMGEYYRKTAPLTGYYHALGKLRVVDGMGEIDEVKAEIAAILDS